MGQDGEVGPDFGGRTLNQEPWDYEKALEEDRRFERRLPWKELATFVLVICVLAIRIFFG